MTNRMFGGIDQLFLCTFLVPRRFAKVKNFCQKTEMFNYFNVVFAK